MRKKKHYKVIIDTNLWISFLIGKRLKKLKPLIVQQKVKLIITDRYLQEINIVTKRPKLYKYFPKEKVEELLIFLKAIGIFINIKSKVNICRDPKDNYLLSLSSDSNADYLVTGDEDLLILKKFKNTLIIKYKEFEKILENSTNS